MVPLIQEELNIKNVDFENDLSTYMNYELKPAFSVAGPVMGSDIKAFGEYLAKEDPAKVLAAGEMELELNGNKYTVGSDMIDVKINAKEGFAVAMENNVFVILDTNLNQDLVDEGFAREVVSKVQQLRKQKDLEMMDNITITLSCDDEVAAAVEKHKDYIMSETLAVEMTAGEASEKFDINGHETGIVIEKK